MQALHRYQFIDVLSRYWNITDSRTGIPAVHSSKTFSDSTGCVVPWEIRDGDAERCDENAMIRLVHISLDGIQEMNIAYSGCTIRK
jgi:hypothetical protein